MGRRTRSSSMLALSLSVVLSSGCGQQVDSLAMPPDKRQYDTARLVRGETSFNQYCASCHGEGATGAADWRIRDDSGRFPPPPLNGTGHAWHHPLEQLRRTINDGGPAGQSNMPAWGDTLSGEQIDDMIAWFQSLWPGPIYEAWYGIEERAQQRTKGP